MRESMNFSAVRVSTIEIANAGRYSASASTTAASPTRHRGRAAGTGAPNTDIPPPPPQHHGAAAEKDERHGSRQTEKLIGQSEKLTLMSCDAHPDNAIQPKRPIEVLVPDDNARLRVNLNRIPERAVLRVRFDGPCFPGCGGRPDLYRGRKVQRGCRRKQSIERSIRIGPVHHGSQIARRLYARHIGHVGHRAQAVVIQCGAARKF